MMAVARSKRGIVVSQQKHVFDFLKETRMLIENNYKHSITEESPPIDKGRCQCLVGKLIYMSHTRLDIGFLVAAASYFMNNPTEKHMEGGYCIFKYLKMTSVALFFKKIQNWDIQIYSDLDWAGSVIDWRSTTSYCTYVWGILVAWNSKKQSIFASSSGEAKFIAMAYGIFEGMWLKKVLDELKILSGESMKINCDNQASIIIAKNIVYHDRTKHVKIDFFFFSKCVCFLCKAS